MNKIVFASIALLTAATLTARAEPTPFVDVPVCHWASTAINQAVDSNVPAPAKSAATAQNAVRQVFEGMQCGSSDWVSRFVEGAPGSLSGFAAQKLVRGFDVTFGKTVVNASKASVSFTATITYTASGKNVTVKRSGTAALTANEETAWRVAYSSLSKLDLPFFPK